jgi:hypothetical protein
LIKNRGIEDIKEISYIECIKKENMSTRSRIAIENQDGTVDSIYCHFDGYLEGVGKTLFNHYDQEKLEKLLELGDISSLGTSTTDTVAYCRDRGEDLHFKTFKDVEDLFENGFNSLEEYVYYLTKDGVWLMYTLQNTIKILKDELEE